MHEGHNSFISYDYNPYKDNGGTKAEEDNAQTTQTVWITKED